MSLHIFGDIHFSSLQPWRLPLGNAFLDWLDTYQPGPREQNSFLCLGDYTDSAVLPGEEVAQLKRFIDIAKNKFKQVYLLTGNHDLKLYKNKPQLSFEFLKYEEGVTILREPGQVLDIEGIHILSLPHYNYRMDLPSMWDYYGNLPNEVRDQHFDLVCGHFSDNSTQLFDHTIDISYLKTEHIALGHQHIRASSHYTGSLFPCKISENDSPQPRAIWVLEKKGDRAHKHEVPLPKFGEYRAVEYPKPLPTSNALVTVWTVLGCESEKIARDFYGDIFIRGVAMNYIKKNNNIVASDDAFVLGDPVTVFNEWMKVAKTPVSRPVAALVRKMLAPAVPSTN
jgi:UDP-2,3-diacylglucosamine pyrophosphatase LpxH